MKVSLGELCIFTVLLFFLLLPVLTFFFYSDYQWQFTVRGAQTSNDTATDTLNQDTVRLRNNNRAQGIANIPRQTDVSPDGTIVNRNNDSVCLIVLLYFQQVFFERIYAKDF